MMFTYDTMIKEVQRELAMRAKVFPKHVAAKKMTEDQAQERVAIMVEVLNVLVALRNKNEVEAQALQLARDGSL